MIVAYALSIVEEAIPFTYREAKISSEFKMWKDAMMKEMSSLYKNDTWEYQSCPKERRRLIVSEYLQRNIDLSMVILYAAKPDWYLKATLSEKALTTMRYSHLL